MAARTSLTGVSISSGYPQLLHVADTGGLTSALVQVYDGDGTASVAWMSTAEIRFGDASNYAGIGNAGDVVFVGGGGLQVGGIHAHDNATETSFPGTGNVDGTTNVQVTIFNTNDPGNGSCTPDHTNDHITVGKAGVYLIVISASIESVASGGADIIGFHAAYNNKTAITPSVHTERTLTGGGGDIGSLSMSGITALPSGATVELWCWNADVTVNNILISDASMAVIQVGG